MARTSRLLGLEIEWRVNILALLAFILSLASIVYNAVGYFEGARIEQHPPTQVILFTYDPPDIVRSDTLLPYDQQTLTFVSTQSYVNRGRPRYKDTISAIRLNFNLPDGTGPYEADWHAVVSFDGLVGTLKQLETASALTLPGEASEAIEAWFVPRQRSDRVSIAKLREQFEAALAGEILEWSITLQSRSDLRGETPALKAVCNVEIGPRVLQNLSDPTIGWAALNCLDG